MSYDANKIVDAQNIIDRVTKELEKQSQAFDALGMHGPRDRARKMAVNLKNANGYIDQALTPRLT